MSELEIKVNAMARMLLATDSTEAKTARQKLMSLMESGSAAQIKLTAEDHIMEILMEIGVPDHLIGHRYLKDDILSVIEDPNRLNKVVYSLYPAIAKLHGSNVSRVERAMRTAIEAAFDRADYDVICKYFGNTINANKGKPTNSEFIARIANIVKMRMKHAA